MPNPLTTKDMPMMTDKKTRKVYIKNGKRKMMSSDGHMMMDANKARRIFGRQKGGKYSLKQDK